MVTVKYLCGLKAHKATGSCRYTTTVAGNSNDSNRIRTRLHEDRKNERQNIIIQIHMFYASNDHEEELLNRSHLHPNHLDPVDSSSSSF